MISTINTTTKESATLGLTAADAVWIATAMLHKSHPDANGFVPSMIQEEVLRNRLTSVLPKTIYQHIVQHVTAAQPANPNRRRMLTELSDGSRRLFIEGDAYHPTRNGAQFMPKPEDLPPQLHQWLSWYESWSRNHPDRKEPAHALDPLQSLAGTWTFGDADTYVRELREGWE